MGVKLASYVAAIVFSAFCADAAFAAWNTSVEDDLFADGKKAVMIGFISADQALHFKCSPDEEVSFSFLEAGDWDNGSEAVSVDLVIKVDENEKMGFKANFYQHNSRYIGIGAEGGERMIILVEQIKNARKQILVGIRIPSIDKKWSTTVSVAGSTRAAASFQKACALNMNLTN